MTETENIRFVKARREFIASDFAHLNDMQKKAVMTTEGPLLLLAGAGSGKTTVLINRVANLLKYGRASDSDEMPEYIDTDDLEFLEDYVNRPDEDGRARAESLCALDPVEPWRIIAITFTNKAASELKDRLGRMLGEAALDIWAMTFHSACARILRRDIGALGYDTSFTIYDTADSVSLMKTVMRELNISDKAFPPRMILSQISRAKDGMISPEQMTEEAEKSFDIRKKTIAAAYTEYASRLKKANAVDFDDLILLTVRLLREHEDVRRYYQRKFRYVLIDEYQDTNNLQYMLSSLLAGGYGNICVVGDDDQSIYKFRGATIENILSFENQYKNARTIRLEQNYRSTGHILAAANAVIRNNSGRKGKELWTDHGDGEKLCLYVAPSDDDEAQYVAGQILAGVAAGQPWSDFAVLYRMNALSNRLEFAFKRNGIPYKVFGGQRFFDRAEIKDMLAYLCVINNPDDDVRLLRIINTPSRGIGAKTVDTVRDIAASEGVSMFAVVSGASGYPQLKSAASKLESFAGIIMGLKKLAETIPLPDFYDMVVQYTGYVRALEEKMSVENQTRIENVNELKSSIVTYANEAEEPSLSGFLDEIALYTDLDQADSDGGYVYVMTIHSAKGLEFPTVFVVGAEDGIFPGSRAIGEIDEMEEERRLCYVAMTRAMTRLYITAAQRRMLFGKTSSNMLSRFIDEIPDEDIEKHIPKVDPFLQGSALDGYFSGAGLKTGFSGGTGFSDRRSYASGYNGYGSAQPKGGASAARPRPAGKKPQPDVLSEYKTGDSVRHTAFGDGVIVSLKPMGGDALIEVEFENVGSKRLMLKAAAKHMEKI